MQRTATGSISLLALLVGFCAGYAIGQHHSSSAPKAEVKPTTAPLTSEPATKPGSSATPVKLPPGTTPGERRVVITGANGTERLLLLRSLVDEGFASTNVYVLYDEGLKARLASKFVELFALTPDEETEINAAVHRVGEESERLQGQLAKGHAGDDGSWVIEIPTFPEAGGRLFDDVNGTFGRVLGPLRYEMFQRFYGEYLNNMFGNLGTRDRQIIIKRKPELLAGHANYEWTDRFVQVDGFGTFASSGTAFRDNVEARFGDLLRQHVSPEFWEH